MDLQALINRHCREARFNVRQLGPVEFEVTFAHCDGLKVHKLADTLGGDARLIDRGVIEIDGIELRLRLIANAA